jgi:hydroxymethylglutaryl-CoA reductase
VMMMLKDSIEATVAGRNVYLRFACMAGDAMGMNMVSKGCLKAIEVSPFPQRLHSQLFLSIELLIKSVLCRS